MSFVFISHAGDDKPRIRFVTDKLIEAGFTLWVDRPLDLLYSAQEIKDHFLRIEPGLHWELEINKALDEAHCVLFLASARFLEKGRDKWHEEVLFALMKGTLVTVKIDDIDLRSAPVRRLKDIQWDDLRLQGRTVQQTESRLELLIDAVRKKLDEPRAKRFGTFSVPDLHASAVLPTEEQIESFFMMLDREREIDALSASRSPVSIVRAAPEARPPSLRRRLHDIEFPCRFPDPVDSKVGGLDRIGPTERRALMLSGESQSPGRWVPVHVSWPIGDQPAPPDPGDTFLRTLVGRSPRALQSVEMSGSHSETAAKYLERLQEKELRIFVYSWIEGADALERRHASLTRLLCEIFAAAPVERFRIFLSSGPRRSSPWLNWLSRRAVQSDRAVRREEGPSPIDLGDIEQRDLEEWINLMNQLVYKSRWEIEQVIARAFSIPSYGSRAVPGRISLAALEKQLKPETERWPLRKRKDSDTVWQERSKTMGWSDVDG